MVQALATRLALVDSNILVYVIDPRDLVKSEKAEALLDALEQLGRGVLSAQCLSEFFSNATRLPDPLTRAAAAAHVARWAGTFPVLDITGQAVQEACRRSALSQMAIWDALIWSVAKQNGVSTILTEDLPGGRRTIDGVRYINPLRP